jgi:hypothetical protein
MKKLKALSAVGSMRWLCRFVGHTGDETESGYHVCSRCGLHEYHCWPEYQRAGLLWRPLWWVQMKLSNGVRPIVRRRKFKLRRNDDVPF